MNELVVIVSTFQLFLKMLIFYISAIVRLFVIGMGNFPWPFVLKKKMINENEPILQDKL